MVADALRHKRPIVAPESTIITHGIRPWPQKLDMARKVEATMREAGAVPATIAVLEGKPCIGLGDVQLQMLARAKDVAKLSRADLAVCMSQGGVGATMIAANCAGIAVFVTGGIGGVHPRAKTSFDISTDLIKLAQTAVTPFLLQCIFELTDG